MKRQLLFPVMMIAVVLMFSSFSGGKCKFDYDKKDDFSGKSVRWTKYEVYMRPGYKANSMDNYAGEVVECDLQFGDNAGQLNIKTDLVIGGEARDIMTQSDTSFIKLENGKIIKIVSSSEYSPVARVDRQFILTDYKPVYNISKAKMGKLSESPIVAIKFKVGAKDYTMKPKESKAAKLMETAACLLSEGGE